MQTIKYAVRYETHQVTDAEFDIVRTLMLAGAVDNALSTKLIAIKFIRNQYKIGLKEAKEVCEAIMHMDPRPIPQY